MTSPSSEMQKIIAVANQEAASMANGETLAYFGILCHDAVFLPPNMPALAGEDLRRWLGDFVEKNATEWLRFEHGQTVITGEMAFHEYVYTMKVTPRAGGPPTVGYGKGLQIFRREPDASWKILRNVWNARPADCGA